MGDFQQTIRSKQPMSWNIDTHHTSIQFTVRHMMISKVRGEFEKFSGTVNLDDHNPANTTVDITVEAASINTHEPQRDGHLRSPDFLNADQYPNLTFKSKRVEVLGKDRARLVADLTIRDVTREIVLDVEYTGMAKSPFGTTNAGFTATTRINRKDWNLTWNMALETGGVLVAEEVNISVELELVKQPEAAAA
jgi:polyisoprenoid-binding protein YceI